MRKLLLTGLLGLCVSAASAEPIRIGELGIVADAPFYIAIEKGYFAEQKLEVKRSSLTSRFSALK